MDTVRKSYEKLSNYLVKGQSVLVYGELSINEYLAKDGTHKASMKCRVSEIELLGSKKDAEGNGHTNNSPSYDHQAPSRPAGGGEPSVDFSDDIPF